MNKKRELVNGQLPFLWVEMGRREDQAARFMGSSDTCMALTGQIGTQRPQAVHFSGSKRISMSGRCMESAPVGQMPVHAPH